MINSYQSSDKIMEIYECLTIEGLEYLTMDNIDIHTKEVDKLL